MSTKWEIAIVGGTGGMGQIFAKELKHFASIVIISRSLEKAKQISEKLGVRSGLLKNCNTADITIVSVPIKNTYEICQNLLHIMKPGSLLIDVSAVKKFVNKLEQNLPNHLSYISMHPLFGPEGSFRDFNVILIPIKDQNNWLANIQELLQKLGSTTTITTPKEHDLIMSKIQVAHHFLYLLLALYLNDAQISPKFFTRSFQKTLSNFIGLEKNFNAILEIQLANPHAETTRKELLSILKQFVSLDDTSKLQELQMRLQNFSQNFLGKKRIN